MGGGRKRAKQTRIFREFKGIHIIGKQRENKENRAEEIFEEIMAENLPKLDMTIISPEGLENTK